eukprot:1158780-Pelagomonas_calceolata.AAC.20
MPSVKTCSSDAVLNLLEQQALLPPAAPTPQMRTFLTEAKELLIPSRQNLSGYTVLQTASDSGLFRRPLAHKGFGPHGRAYKAGMP